MIAFEELMLRSLLPALMLPLLLETAALAKESPLDAAARAHFESGQRFFLAKDFKSALVEFEAGLKLSQHPTFLFNLAKAAEGAGMFDKAWEYAEQYKATLTEPDEPFEQWMAKLPPRTSPAKPAEPVVAVVPQEPAKPPISDAPPKKLRRTPWGAWALVGTGGALLLTDAILSGVAYQKGKSLSNARLTQMDLDAQIAAGNRLNNASIALLVLGVGAAAGGTVWLLVDHRQHKAP